MTKQTDTWLSSYIYCPPPQEAFLINDLFPFVRKSFHKKNASQFFFIRYYDRKGMHIRLRLKGNKKVLENEIKPLLITAFNSYQIRFVRYVPETKRYGGKIGIILAEKQFEASSRAVLQLLSENKEWDYEHAMGKALQLHLSMAHAFRMSKEEAVSFFAHLAAHGNLQVFEKKLTENHALIAHLANLWRALKQGTIFQEEWFNNWIQNMKTISNQLTNAYHAGQLEISDNPVHQHPLHSLYESYVHMTNNRLGIANSDESYLAYIITCALKNT